MNVLFRKIKEWLSILYMKKCRKVINKAEFWNSFEHGNLVDFFFGRWQNIQFELNRKEMGQVTLLNAVIRFAIPLAIPNVIVVVKWHQSHRVSLLLIGLHLFWLIKGRTGEFLGQEIHSKICDWRERHWAGQFHYRSIELCLPRNWVTVCFVVGGV